MHGMNLQFISGDAPRNVGECIINSGRHDVNVFTENRSRVESERCVGLNA